MEEGENMVIVERMKEDQARGGYNYYLNYYVLFSLLIEIECLFKYVTMSRILLLVIKYLLII
jgi:hypothetical protein